MSALETYYSSVLGILEEVFEREREAMEQAARQEEVYASRTFIPEIPVDYEEQDEGQEA